MSSKLTGLRRSKQKAILILAQVRFDFAPESLACDFLSKDRNLFGWFLNFISHGHAWNQDYVTSGTSLARVVTLQGGHFPRVSTLYRVKGHPVLGFF